jgi:hypothetical protein
MAARLRLSVDEAARGTDSKPFFFEKRTKKLLVIKPGQGEPRDWVHWIRPYSTGFAMRAKTVVH